LLNGHLDDLQLGDLFNNRHMFQNVLESNSVPLLDASWNPKRFQDWVILLFTVSLGGL
jgi:hypothetical protein